MGIIMHKWKMALNYYICYREHNLVGEGGISLIQCKEFFDKTALKWPTQYHRCDSGGQECQTGL